ncbi:MAG: hypothetical protein AAFV29_02145 [Myxococcota bacterium]
MKDPVRWKDDPDAPDGAGELLSVARPPPAMPADVHAALASKIASPMAGSMVSAMGGTKVVVGVVVLSTLAGGVLWRLNAGWPSGQQPSSSLDTAATQPPAVPLPLDSAVIQPPAVLRPPGSAVIRPSAVPRPSAVSPSLNEAPADTPTRSPAPVASVRLPSPKAPRSSSSAPFNAPVAAKSSRPDTSSSSASVPSTALPRVSKNEPPSVRAHRADESSKVSKTASAVDAPEQGLAAEARLLERARLKVRSDPEAALELVQNHAHRFPEGGLVAEREVLAVDILMRLNRRTDAHQRAKRFLQHHHHSPYAAKMQRMLAD